MQELPWGFNSFDVLIEMQLKHVYTHLRVTGEVVKQFIKYYPKVRIHHQHTSYANIYFNAI